MDLDSTVSNVGAALFVMGLLVTMAGLFIERDKIRDLGILAHCGRYQRFGGCGRGLVKEGTDGNIGAACCWGDFRRCRWWDNLGP